MDFKHWITLETPFGGYLSVREDSIVAIRKDDASPGSSILVSGSWFSVKAEPDVIINLWSENRKAKNATTNILPNECDAELDCGAGSN